MKSNQGGLENKHQALVHCLFQLVWADHIVSPNEVQALTTVLLKLGYSLPEVICLLDRELAVQARPSKPHDQALTSYRPSEEEIKLLLAICFSEGTIQPAQIGYIEGLVLRLGLTADALERLQSEALETLSS